MCLLLSNFASKDNLSQMSADELREFNLLTQESDWDLYYWCTNEREPPPEVAASDMFQRLKRFTLERRSEYMKMPELDE